MPSDQDTILAITRTEGSNCPMCGALITAAGCADGVSIPRPGDISVCYRCGATLEFTEDMVVTWMSVETRASLDSDELQAISKMQDFVKKKALGLG